MGTRNHIVQVISILTCAIWLVPLALIIEPEPVGFHTDTDSEATNFAETDIEENIGFASGSDLTDVSETVAGLPSNGFFVPDSAGDPPPSRRSFRRTRVAPFPSAVITRIATTVLRP